MSERIELDPESSYEVTTRGGSRIFLDFRRGRWMRVPEFHDDGTLNLTMTDGRWRRLFDCAALDEDADDHSFHAVIGAPLRIFIGMREWWTTTPVQTVRKVQWHELPVEPMTQKSMGRLIEDEADSIGEVLRGWGWRPVGWLIRHGGRGDRLVLVWRCLTGIDAPSTASRQMADGQLGELLGVPVSICGPNHVQPGETLNAWPRDVVDG